MKNAALALLTIAACERLPAPPGPAQSPATLATDDDRTLYALGALLGKNVQDLHLSPVEVAHITQGLADQALGQPPQADLAIFGPKAQQLGTSRRNAALQASASAQRVKDQPFIEAAAKAPGVVALDGGILKTTLGEGHGESPTASDRVQLTYRATLADGTVFDSTDKHGGEAMRAVNGLIPCLGEALQTMNVGETARLVCPPELAYGDRGRPPGVPSGAALIYELQLLELNPPLPARRANRHGTPPKPASGG